jgi:hypothetical protein
VRSKLRRWWRWVEAAANTARSGRGDGALRARMPAVVPNLDTVDNSNDLHHLRQTYIHLFPLPACRISEYVSGTSLGGARTTGVRCPCLWRHLAPWMCGAGGCTGVVRGGTGSHSATPPWLRPSFVRATGIQ